MSTDSRLPWVIRDVVPGDVTIGDPGPGDGSEFRATVRVKATVINGSGGRSEIRFDAYCGFANHEQVGEAVALVLKSGIEGARKAAQAFCDAANVQHDAPIELEPGTIVELPTGAEISSPAKDAVAAFIAPNGYVEQAYRAGFESSSRDFNFDVLGPAYADSPVFEQLLARDFETILANYEEGASS